MTGKVELSELSVERLRGVKTPLQRVCEEAFKNMPFDIIVLEGMRTLERQKQLVATGKSQTLNSKHLTGDAIDIAPYPIDWNDTSRFKEMAKVMADASERLKIHIVWGGSWKTLVDMPHFQLGD